MTRKISWIEVGESDPPASPTAAPAGLVVAQLLVIRLGSAAQHRAGVVAHRAEIPATDRATLVQVDRDDLAGAGQTDLVVPIEIEIAQLGDVQAAGLGLGQVRGGDQVLVGGQAHVADVDPTEQAVPVGVVRLALVEVIERPRAVVPLGHRIDRVRRPQHLLVHVVDLAVADLEVAPERTAQPACLGTAFCLRTMEGVGEAQALLGRQRPLAHLRVRAGRHVDAADRGMVREPGGRRRGGQPVGVRLERLEEAVDPAALTPAMLPGRRPRPELLAVVAHHPDPFAVLGRVDDGDSR